jgi:hypothetical protein
MHLLLEKLQDKTFSGTREHGDTFLGEEKSWCTRNKGTHCTQHNLHIKYSTISTYQSQNNHERKSMHANVFKTPQGHLTSSLAVDYMHDDMIKILE